MRTVDTVDHDPLDELPHESRLEVIAEVRTSLEVDQATAEDIIRSTEPFWDSMERAGGLVDSWGNGQFCSMLPRVLAFIRTGA